MHLKLKLKNNKIYRSSKWLMGVSGVVVFIGFGFVVVSNLTVFALGSSQNPQSGSLGLEATIPSAPPSTAATI